MAGTHDGRRAPTDNCTGRPVRAPKRLSAARRPARHGSVGPSGLPPELEVLRDFHLPPVCLT
jgi:hypothetical protein